MEFHDYYKTLGVSKDATQEEIQRAYRKLARKLHPDVNKSKDAEEKFKEINEANEVLKDPEKRKRYDTYGHNWQAGTAEPPPEWQGTRFNRGPGPQGFSRTFSFGGNDDFEEQGDYSDFFNTLFGNGPGGRQGTTHHFDMPGRSHEAEITVSLHDVFHGASKEISLQTFALESNGHMRPITKTLQVKIPKGVTNGSVIRLAGQGETGSGQAKAGDLLLRINIAPDARFRVEGHDLHTVVAVSPWEAALGAKIPVHTVDGAVTLAIPKGSQNGRKLRLRGKGIPKPHGIGGDIIVELKICVPAQLSPEEEKLFIELAKVSRFSPRADLKQHRAAA